MTPEQKAEELVRKYYNFGLNNPAQSFSWYECKECALITVDYILNCEPKKAYFIKGHWMTPKTFWKEVKQEIEKL